MAKKHIPTLVWVQHKHGDGSWSKPMYTGPYRNIDAAMAVMHKRLADQAMHDATPAVYNEQTHEYETKVFRISWDFIHKPE